MLMTASFRHDEGYVLVGVLFCFMLMYIIAAAFINSSFLEGLISVNYRQNAQAFEMADAGVLAGTEQIYAVLASDYSCSLSIPSELTLPQKEWILDENGKEMSFSLENPKCNSVDGGKCRFQFTSKGVSSPAQRILQAVVEVEFLDIYRVATDGALVFERREFIPPAQIISFQYKH
jgi:hypothetical protein